MQQRLARKFFLASTVTRAVDWYVPQEQLEKAVLECKKRWMTERKWDTDLAGRLKQYIKLLPIKHHKDAKPQEILPSCSATLSTPRHKGGAAAELISNHFKRLSTKVDVTLTRWEQRSLPYVSSDLPPLSYAERAGGGPPPVTPVELHRTTQEWMEFKENPHLPTYKTIREVYLKQSSIQPLKPHPLQEMGGKVRVISLHPAEETHVARTITKRWLGALKRCVTTRDILRGKEVVLEPQCKQSYAYSADLSAATDYIPHSLAQHVAIQLCDVLERPEDIPLVERLFGPKRIDSQDTRNGIHMGLGPGWTILSLLNSFAAWYAGARKDTYQICGDDLIGFWPRKLCDRYERTLERLGLVVNKSKSFFGRSGVFCERMMVMKEGRLRSIEDGHLSSLTASKMIANRSHSTYETLNALPSSPLVNIRDEIRHGFLPRGNTKSGLIIHGGDGHGGLNIAGLTSLARGRFRVRSAKPLPDHINTYITVNQALSGEVSTLDFKIAYDTGRRLKDLFRGIVPKPNQSLSTKEYVRRRGLSDRKRLNVVGCKEQSSTDPKQELIHKERSQHPVDILISTISRHSSISRKNKDKAVRLCKHFRRTLHRKTKVRRRIEKLLSRPPALRFLSLETCQKFLQEVSHPRLVGRLLGDAAKFSVASLPRPAMYSPWQGAVMAYADH
jgi:hypothetical protein